MKLIKFCPRKHLNICRTLICWRVFLALPLRPCLRDNLAKWFKVLDANKLFCLTVPMTALAETFKELGSFHKTNI